MGRRRVVRITYECGQKDERLFLPNWEDVPQELKDQVQGGLNCDGGGNPGRWCTGCQWEVAPGVEETDDEM